MKERLSRRRLVIAIGVGVLFALFLIWAASTIYDPFMDEIDDPATLLPGDVDFAVIARDLPTLVKGLEDQPFYAALDRHEGIQALLRHPDVRNGSVYPTLHRIFRELSASSVQLPMGLEVIGDVSGRRVVVGGYVGGDGDAADGSVPRIVGIFVPDSIWVIVGANLLLDETLCGTFLEGTLAENGITAIEHGHHTVSFTLTIDGAPTRVSLARAGDAIVVGSDRETVSRIRRDFERVGPRLRPPERFRDDVIWTDDSPTAVDLAVRRRVLDPDGRFRQSVLDPALGSETATVIERFLPPLDGEDVRLRVDVSETLDVRATMSGLSLARRAPFSGLHRIDAATARGLIDTVFKRFPYYAWAFGAIQGAPGELLEFALESPGIMDRDKRDVWFEELANRVPRFASAPRRGGYPDVTPLLVEEVGICADDGAGVVLFTKNRDEFADDAGTGVALVLRIRDRDYLEGLIEEIDRSLQSVRAFERYDAPEIDATLWHITAKGLVDDRTVTDPGFAIIGDHFVFTNWFRVFADMRRAAGPPPNKIPRSKAAEQDHLNSLMDDEGAYCSLYVDGDQLYRYLDTAKETWITRSSKISELEKVEIRKRAMLAAQRRGVAPEEFDAWVNARYRSMIEELRRERSPVVKRREIEARLNWFRGAFSRGVVSLGIDGDAITGRLRITGPVDSD